MNLKTENQKNKKKWLIVGGGAALGVASIGFIALTAQYCSSVKQVREKEKEIILLKLKISDLEKQNQQLKEEKEQLNKELGILRERLSVLQSQYDKSRNAWKSTTNNYLNKINQLNNKINSSDNRFEPTITPENPENSTDISLEEEVSTLKTKATESKEAYKLKLNELKEQLNILKGESNDSDTQRYIDEFIKNLNVKETLIDSLSANSLETITDLINNINDTETEINKQYFNLVAQLTSEIANKKESIKNKEIQLENAFENAKGLIKQIITASDNQIEYVISLRDKISSYLNKDYTQYATVEFANNIKSSAQRLIDDINSYIRELTIAIEQAKLDYDRALKTKNIQDFTSINVESFGIKNKNLLNEFDSLVNKDFEILYNKYISLMKDYSLKSKELVDLDLENKSNLDKISNLNTQLSNANENIKNLQNALEAKKTELKDKLINSLIEVKSLLDSNINALENDSVDNSSLVEPLKEQKEFITEVLTHSFEENFVENYQDSSKNALGLISDLLLNYQNTRIIPLEGEIAELNLKITKLDTTIAELNKNLEAKNELIKQYEQQIAELQREKESLTTQLNSTIEQLNQTNSELNSLKVANASLLASQQDELAKVNSKLETLITKSNELLIDSVESEAKTKLQNLINSEFTTEIPVDINTVNARIKFNTELSLALINKFNEVLKANYDNKLSEKISELEQISAQKDQIEQAKNSLENELRTKVAENTSISEELTNLIQAQNTIIESQGTKFDELVSKYNQLRQQAEELLKNSEESKQKTQLQNKLSETVNLDKSQELSGIVEQNNNISDFNISLVGLMKELIKTNYDKKIEAKDDYAKMLNTQLNAANYAKEELNKAFTRVSDENTELKKNQSTKVQELQAQLVNANAETRRQSQLVAEKERRIQELISSSSNSEEIQRLNSQISTLESEKRTLESEKTRLTSELSRVKADNLAKDQIIEELQNKLQTALKKLNNIQSKNTKKNKKLVIYDFVGYRQQPSTLLHDPTEAKKWINQNLQNHSYRNFENWFDNESLEPIYYEMDPYSTYNPGQSPINRLTHWLYDNSPEELAPIQEIFSGIPSSATSLTAHVIVNSRLETIQFKKTEKGWFGQLSIPFSSPKINILKVKYEAKSSSTVSTGYNYFSNYSGSSTQTIPGIVEEAYWNGIVKDRLIQFLQTDSSTWRIKLRYNLELDVAGQTGAGKKIVQVDSMLKPLEDLGSVVLLDLEWE
ncbi:hypothetical protein DP067_01965 [Mycoplasmopsis anatis]|uniref:Uncharacterized protein n=1 Tax=Mycoplasmopsis anatis 1340 TaxID=1034808 RepID=F9QEN5_9BACT|nr:hypothetical protein [Mycoplasmopsis anatis]AWX70122.1 hypothetical protein DP067_01965 [Mycoplasmopsis anatis]EGS28798.1 hypothetical protein GIG_00560 [Mycoplasmopsis anatis 1340]VEU73437.1 Uncharacterised protein [Mycoplasmopsis anatis]